MGSAQVVLTTGRDPKHFEQFPRVSTPRDALQLAALLAEQGVVANQNVALVARALRRDWRWSADDVRASLTEMRDRALVPEGRADAISALI